MKELVQDVLSVFSPQSVNPVLIRPGLSPREIASVQPFGITSVSWVTSMEELESAFVRKAQEAGAVGYHITDVESHKSGSDGQRLLAGKATLYTLPDHSGNEQLAAGFIL
ncbi:DUF1471 domain-containing protein [Candidatus Pantoea deserta]|uniref:DUF1471 domain-containing protein n=1 Tax=Candidatus Pantoea deserta TaxID=1869313 RepID=A0A3N4NGR2_9GAMM|nr:DUF1471 domain-containing protein [Pantoea deserta]RPD94635.1 DUF1471 domain-containing protein [Pantoea deserta]